LGNVSEITYFVSSGTFTHKTTTQSINPLMSIVSVLMTLGDIPFNSSRGFGKHFWCIIKPKTVKLLVSWPYKRKKFRLNVEGSPCGYTPGNVLGSQPLPPEVDTYALTFTFYSKHAIFIHTVSIT